MSLDWIDHELRRLRDANLFRQRVIRSGKLTGMIVVDGKRYVNFGSNDYLGIASDPELNAVLANTVLRGGWGSGASPSIIGRTSLHAELERRLATFLEAEAALLFPTGFAANVGTIPALVGRGDTVFSDAKNHASIIDGCRLSGASIVIYPHGDMDFLRTQLAAVTSQIRDTQQNRLVTDGNSAVARRMLIVSDSLFSMDGDLARVDSLVELAGHYGAMLMLDEAHAVGAIGPDGKGVASLFECVNKVDVRVGTLSKALGSHGGFVIGSRALIDFLANRARSYVFSTASPASTASAALVAIKIMRDEPQRLARLKRVSEQVRHELLRQGWDVGSSVSHIVPVRLGAPRAAIELSQEFRHRGMWLPCIRPPSVPAGESLLRISLCSNHSDAMLDVLLRAFQEIRMKWPQFASHSD